MNSSRCTLVLPNVKSALLIFFCISLHALSPAQTKPAIKRPVVAFPLPPKEARASTDSLAGYFHTQYTDPNQRLKAIYAFVVGNIRYDHVSAFEFTQPRIDDAHRADSCLAAGQDVCAGIAILMETLCRKSGLKAYAVSGYARQNGFVGHAWVVAEGPGGWAGYDPTWDINQRENPAMAQMPWTWFGLKPDVFIRTHMPFDPMWQLLPATISYQDFDQRRFALTKPSAAPFAYTDSISTYQTLTQVQQMQASYRRMVRYKATNYATTAYAHLLQESVRVSKYNEIAAILDSATLHFNTMVQGFNQYVKHYNKRFEDIPNDAYLKDLVAQIERDMEESQTLYDQVLPLTEEGRVRTAIGVDLQSLAENRERFQQHKAFVEKYLSKGKLGRGFMWMSPDLPR